MNAGNFFKRPRPSPTLFFFFGSGIFSQSNKAKDNGRQWMSYLMIQIILEQFHKFRILRTNIMTKLDKF